MYHHPMKEQGPIKDDYVHSQYGSLISYGVGTYDSHHV